MNEMGTIVETRQFDNFTIDVFTEGSGYGFNIYDGILKIAWTTDKAIRPTANQALELAWKWLAAKGLIFDMSNLPM